jgi:hypothetical protein
MLLYDYENYISNKMLKRLVDTNKITLILKNIFERLYNGTAHFKNLSNCLNTKIYSYLETSGGQSSNPYLNVFHFLNTRAD